MRIAHCIPCLTSFSNACLRHRPQFLVRPQLLTLA